MKLTVYVKFYSDPSLTTRHSLDYQTQIWAATEHGLSLFAASILALKPVYNYISKSWTRLSSNFSGIVISGKDSRSSQGSGSRSRVSGASLRNSKPKNMWSLSENTRDTSTELGTIDVRNDVEVRMEDNVKQLKHPSYMVDAYNDSQRRLVDQESKGFQEV